MATTDAAPRADTAVPAPTAGHRWDARTASLTAGVSLVLMAALAGVGVFAAVGGLVTPGDATRTLADIRASEGLFRLGIASLIGVVALDVVVAWALHRVFRPVHPGASLLAAAFRIVYSGVFLVAIAELLGVLRMLGSEPHVQALGPEVIETQVMLRIDAFHDIWAAALVIFGLHLLIVGYLTYRAVVLPRFLGILVAIAGLGYMFDSLAAALRFDVPEVSTITFPGEVLLALWLLTRSRCVGVLDDPSARARRHPADAEHDATHLNPK
jgi:hypothetical protein